MRVRVAHWPSFFLGQVATQLRLQMASANDVLNSATAGIISEDVREMQMANLRCWRAVLTQPPNQPVAHAEQVSIY